VNVPTAVNVWFNPNGIAAVVGLTVIETTEAGVTVSRVDPLVPPRVAVIVAVPVATEVASAPDVTVATAAFPELQVGRGRQILSTAIRKCACRSEWLRCSQCDGRAGRIHGN